jgi:hypothetical protein
MTTQEIEILKDKHKGKACYIVGTGPSILKLTETSFEIDCPIIAINRAGIVIEKLNITNPIYSMQKDGNAFPYADGTTYTHCPIKAALIIEVHTSKELFQEYSPRYIFNAETLRPNPYGWQDFSANCALKIAEIFGCPGMKFMGMDAYWGDNRNMYDIIANYYNKLYSAQIPRLKKRIEDDNLKVEWIR